MPEDALLKELQGTAKIENVDPLPEQDKTDPLQVQPDPVKTEVQKADLKHSKEAGGKGYQVRLTGEYYAPAPGGAKGKIKKPYELTLNVPSLDGVLSLIKAHLLMPALQAKYPDVVTFRTHYISDVKPLTTDTPESNHLHFMTRERLEAFIREKGAPIDPECYDDTSDLRTAVIDFTLNPKGFKKREERKQAERKQKAGFLAMNPEIGK